MKALIIVSFLLLLPIVLWAQKTQGAPEVTYPVISKELISRRKDDQKYRNKYVRLIEKGKQGTKKHRSVTKKLLAIDRENTERMREIVAEIGWPTYDKVGRRASHTAWLLVQHADRRPLFQAECLPLLQAAMEAEQISPSNYAYLYDRVQIARGDKQLYATQSATNPVTDEKSFATIADEAGVQERRAKMDIEQPIREYAASMGFSYDLPDAEEAEKREQERQATVDAFLKKAKHALAAKDYPAAAKNYLEAASHYGYLTTEDYVAAARAVALAQQADYARVACHHLKKALLRGYPDHANLATAEDFAFLRSSSPENWADLMILEQEISGK